MKSPFFLAIAAILIFCSPAVAVSYAISQQGAPAKIAIISRANTDGSVTQIPAVQGNADCYQFLLDWKAGALVTLNGTSDPYSTVNVQVLGLTAP